MPRPINEFRPADIHRILRVHVGRARAIKGERIAQRLGYTGRYGDRGIRAGVRELRREGVLILSATDEPAGYFLAATPEEWHRYGEPLRSRATDLLKTVAQMDRAAAARFNVPEELRPAVQLDLRLI